MLSWLGLHFEILFLVHLNLCVFQVGLGLWDSFNFNFCSFVASVQYSNLLGTKVQIIGRTSGYKTMLHLQTPFYHLQNVPLWFPTSSRVSPFSKFACTPLFTHVLPIACSTAIKLSHLLRCVYLLLPSIYLFTFMVALNCWFWSYRGYNI